LKLPNASGRIETESRINQGGRDIQGDSEISLEKKTVTGDDEKKSLTKKNSYKSFFVFEIQMIENLVKIVSAPLS
jgi:hypothetical protein